ncbi:MAG: ORF6N domain-containing protein, partial [Pseudomonadota bacterium]
MNDLVVIDPGDGGKPSVPIVEIDGKQVVLDQDLATIFEVKTGVLNQAVKRKRARFPESWLFQLTDEQFDDLKSQSVISSDEWGGRRYAPWAFTEHGVVLASTMVNTDRAIEMTQYVVEAFVAFQRQFYDVELLDTETSKPSRISKLQGHLDNLLELRLGGDANMTIGEGAMTLAGESMSALRARLKREGLKTAEIEAKIAQMAVGDKKTHAETDSIIAGTERQRLDAQIAAV